MRPSARRRSPASTATATLLGSNSRACFIAASARSSSPAWRADRDINTYASASSGRDASPDCLAITVSTSLRRLVADKFETRARPSAAPKCAGAWARTARNASSAPGDRSASRARARAYRAATREGAGAGFACTASSKAAVAREASCRPRAAQPRRAARSDSANPAAAAKIASASFQRPFASATHANARARAVRAAGAFGSVFRSSSASACTTRPRSPP